MDIYLMPGSVTVLVAHQLVLTRLREKERNHCSETLLILFSMGMKKLLQNQAMNVSKKISLIMDTLENSMSAGYPLRILHRIQTAHLPVYWHPGFMDNIMVIRRPLLIMD